MTRLQRLTSEAFAPYGHVASPGSGLVKSIRGGGVKLTRSPAAFQHSDAALDFALDFYEVRCEGSVLDVAMAENHPNSSQMFIPVSLDRYLVVVWPDHPSTGVAAQAFVAGRDQVVVYNPGVWHHGIVALDGDALFASAMWRTRGGTDVEFFNLDRPFGIALDQEPA